MLAGDLQNEKKSISPLETDWLFFGVNGPFEIQLSPSPLAKA